MPEVKQSHSTKNERLLKLPRLQWETGQEHMKPTCMHSPSTSKQKVFETSGPWFLRLKDLVSVKSYNNNFAKRCLQTPIRRRKRASLVSAVNEQIRTEGVLCPCSITPTPRCKRVFNNKAKDPLEVLAHKVSAKIEEGNLKGAVRLICSEEVIADASDETFAALKAKHPHTHADSVFPSLSNISQIPDELVIPVPLVQYAIRSFPRGSAGGPDGLTPQHLKDMLRPPAGEGGASLLLALSSFVNMVFRGEILAEVGPLFFGANLTALRKKGRGASNCSRLYSPPIGCEVCQFDGQGRNGRATSPPPGWIWS